MGLQEPAPGRWDPPQPRVVMVSKAHGGTLVIPATSRGGSDYQQHPQLIDEETEARKGQAAGPGLCGWRAVGVRPDQSGPSIQAPSGSTWRTGLARGARAASHAQRGPAIPPLLPGGPPGSPSLSSAPSRVPLSCPPSCSAAPIPTPRLRAKVFVLNGPAIYK